jgi:general secretion pathway protein M
MSRFSTLFDSARTRRISAVALLILATLLVIAAVAVPSWFLYQRYQEKEAMMTRQLSSYTALNQLRPKMMQAVEILKAKETKKYFLKGATPGLAGADLQDVVKALIESNNARVFSAQLLPHKDDNGYRLVAVTISMSSTIQNLRQVLYAIESREPYLTIDNISIRSQVPSGFKPAPGGEPDMFIQFDVSGLAPIVAAESAPAAGKATSATKAKAAS